MLRLITDGCLTADEIINIREKQEKINTVLFDSDDFVRCDDFDEYKVAKALYESGDRDLCIRYLSVCLSKWVDKHDIVSCSPMRDHFPMEAQGRASSREEESLERKAEAEGFIKSVNTYFPELLSLKGESITETMMLRLFCLRRGGWYSANPICKKLVKRKSNKGNPA